MLKFPSRQKLAWLLFVTITLSWKSLVVSGVDGVENDADEKVAVVNVADCFRGQELKLLAENPPFDGEIIALGRGRGWDVHVSDSKLDLFLNALDLMVKSAEFDVCRGGEEQEDVGGFRVQTLDLEGDRLKENEKYERRRRSSGSGVRGVTRGTISGIEDIVPESLYASGSLGGFWTLSETYAFFQDLLDDHPGDVNRTIHASASVENRDIHVYKTGPFGAPGAFINSITHAREPPSLSTVGHGLAYLLKARGRDAEAEYIMSHRRILWMPMVNPDGYVTNELGYPSSKLWRKNMAVNSGTSCLGVDLNRNFDDNWTGPYSSTNPCSNIYQGPSAFSEPESQLFRDVSISEDIATCSSYHAYAEVYIWPYGWSTTSGDYPPGDRGQAHVDYGTLMAKYNGYDVGNAWETLGGAGDGAQDDWLESNANGCISFTPEVGTSFWPSTSSIGPIARENLWSVKVLALAAGPMYEPWNVDLQAEALSFSIKNLGQGDSVGSLRVAVTSLTPWISVVSGGLKAESAGTTSGPWGVLLPEIPGIEARAVSNRTYAVQLAMSPRALMAGVMPSRALFRVTVGDDSESSVYTHDTTLEWSPQSFSSAWGEEDTKNYCRNGGAGTSTNSDCSCPVNWVGERCEIWGGVSESAEATADARSPISVVTPTSSCWTFGGGSPLYIPIGPWNYLEDWDGGWVSMGFTESNSAHIALARPGGSVFIEKDDGEIVVITDVNPSPVTVRASTADGRGLLVVDVDSDGVDDVLALTTSGYGAVFTWNSLSESWSSGPGYDMGASGAFVSASVAGDRSRAFFLRDNAVGGNCGVFDTDLAGSTYSVIDTGLASCASVLGLDSQAVVKASDGSLIVLSGGSDMVPAGSIPCGTSGVDAGSLGPWSFDVSGDGFPELVAECDGNAVLLQWGSAAWSQVVLQAVPPGMQLAGPGDVDNDGNLDLVWTPTNTEAAQVGDRDWDGDWDVVWIDDDGIAAGNWSDFVASPVTDFVTPSGCTQGEQLEECRSNVPGSLQSFDWHVYSGLKVAADGRSGLGAVDSEGILGSISLDITDRCFLGAVGPDTGPTDGSDDSGSDDSVDDGDDAGGADDSDGDVGDGNESGDDDDNDDVQDGDLADEAATSFGSFVRTAGISFLVVLVLILIIAVAVSKLGGNAGAGPGAMQRVESKGSVEGKEEILGADRADGAVGGSTSPAVEDSSVNPLTGDVSGAAGGSTTAVAEASSGSSSAVGETAASSPGSTGTETASGSPGTVEGAEAGGDDATGGSADGADPSSGADRVEDTAVGKAPLDGTQI